MRLGARAPWVVALLVCLAAAAHAEPPAKKRPTDQERKRKQLLDELGLEKVNTPKPPATPSPGQQPPEESQTAAPPANEPSAPRAATATSPAAASAPSFRRTIHPLLVQSCQVCHRAEGPARATRLLLVGEVAADYAAVRPFVTPAAPPTSTLLLKSSGQNHGGGAPWPANGEAQTRVLAWIAKGARLDGAAAPTAPAAVSPESQATDHRAPAPRGPTARPPVEPLPPTAAAGVPTPAATPAGGPSTDIHALLMATCAPCHSARGQAAVTRFVLSGDLEPDDAKTRALIDLAAPARSPLVTKATGELHGGGVVLGPNDPRLAALTTWIATLSAQGAPPAVSPLASAPPAEAPAVGVPVPTAPAPAAPPLARGGLPLAGGFLLNGRFDLAYERHQFSGDPFAEGSTTALRSYHHFLFLSRESADDPFGLSIEILTLQFWEVHARLGGGGRPWHLLLSGGKILVPFGADPLTHQSYGGLAGFDQRVLPPVWAQEGAAAHLTFERGRLVLTDDAYVVRGYALPRADAFLNLQADFSPTDEARLAWGNRVGAAWMNASAWYSSYFNTLGFGRRLFMQAADLTISRPRTIPVLGHFSMGAGLLRADMSGGGAGADYYDFGSYFQLRYHPTDWLFLQYRQGLATFNNRRGVIVDETRLTPEDMSTHNFAVVARCRGLSVTLAYFLILEKAGEIPNDFLRLSAAYDF